MTRHEALRLDAFRLMRGHCEMCCKSYLAHAEGHRAARRGDGARHCQDMADVYRQGYDDMTQLIAAMECGNMAPGLIDAPDIDLEKLLSDEG